MLAERAEQCLRADQVCSTETFAEQSVNGCERMTRLTGLTLLMPQPRETGGAAELPRQRILPARPLDGRLRGSSTLAAPTRTRQRDQAVCDHQIGYLADLYIPADQLGDRLRKIALHCRSRTRRCRGRTDFARELIASPCNGAYEVA